MGRRTITRQMLIYSMRQFDPNFDFAEHYTLTDKDFWRRLKFDFGTVDSIYLALNESVCREYIRNHLKKYNLDSGRINYAEICDKLNWKSFDIGIIELYKTMSLAQICRYIEENTGALLYTFTIRHRLVKVGVEMRPVGGANLPGCKKAKDVYAEMQKYGLDKLKEMGAGAICREFGINAPMFERIRDKYKLEYKRKPYVKQIKQGHSCEMTA